MPWVDKTSLRGHSQPAVTQLRLATVLQVLAAALEVAPLIGIWLVADAAYRSYRDPALDLDGRIWTGLLIVVLGSLLGFAATGAAYYVTHLADLRVRRRVRLRLAEHLGRLPLGWFDSAAAGRALQAFGDDVEAMHTAIAHGRMELIAATVTPTVAWIWLVTVDWRIAVIILIPVLISHLLGQRIHQRAQAFLPEQGAAITELTAAANEELRDAVSLRVTARALPTSSRLLTASKRLHTVIVASHQEQESRGTKIAALVDPAFALLVALVAGYFLLPAAAPATDVIPFVVAAVLISGAPATITLARWGIVAAASAAARIDALLDEPAQSEPDRPLTPRGADIEIDGVVFGYEAESRVLDDVSLTIPEGSFTALVGPSGSGKSTLAALIGRHHDPTAGSVRVGGVDLRSIASRDLHRIVTVLPQRAVLLRTTVRDNIALARPDADDAAVVAAARTARIHDRVGELENGYETVVGDDIGLSSGERQRIALARALLADPRILVLDEPTSNVDPESAAAIHRSLHEIAEGRTVVLIAHELDTVVDADTIVVVENGRVAQIGTHSELAGSAGLFADMWGVGQTASEGNLQ